jgi:hypothetical protein
MGQGTQAAARVLDELEGKGAEASDEVGNPAQFQQQHTPSENGAEAAIKSPGDSVKFQQQPIRADSVTGDATKSDREAENGIEEKADPSEPSRIFDAVAPDAAEEHLAASFTKNLQLFDLLLRYRTNRHNAYLKKLHDLQRLQAMRQGELIAPPVAVDVNIDSNGGAGEREL